MFPLSRIFKFFAPIFGIALLSFVFAGNVRAGIITEAPDISVFYLHSRMENGNFSADGWATKYLAPSASNSVKIFNDTPAARNFSMTASFDNLGNLLGGGTFSVWGSFVSGGTNVELLSGTITEAQTGAFYDDGIIEFLATGLTGQLSDAYFLDESALRLSTTVTGSDFLSDFSYEGWSAVADIARPVPEPATFSFFLVAFVAGCRRRRILRESE